MKWLIALTALLALSSCGAINIPRDTQVVTENNYIERTIPVQPAPEPVDMPPVEWFVVTEDNIEEFLGRIENSVGDVVFIAVTPDGYENLALGIADLRRYIAQQRSIIAYYEDAVSNNNASETTE